MHAEGRLFTGVHPTHPTQSGGMLQVRSNRSHRASNGSMRRISNEPAGIVRTRTRCADSTHVNRALVRLQQLSDQPHQRGFSASVRPDHAHNSRAFVGPREVADHVSLAKGTTHSFEAQLRAGGSDIMLVCDFHRVTHCTVRGLWPPQAHLMRNAAADLPAPRQAAYGVGTVPRMQISPVSTQPPTHRPTPTGRPSWHSRTIGTENGSFLRGTRDIELRAGNTFPTSFPSLVAAVAHARAASAGDAGAIAVFGPRDGDQHRGRYWLARSYDYLPAPGQTGRRQTQLTGTEHILRWHPEARLLIDGPVAIGPAPELQTNR